ncbi:MAG: tRNA (adenosine(37)-N6)-threonylcarbamoyltransferase complex dimerization subunit type 1 TsaB [Bacteroidia bacterium]|nr:tRNA (adenosine(37)-N6)-threonylcarbamoyltransferase complex dimerization subunit type 1 TsaB [Bacteroidia bacterium]
MALILNIETATTVCSVALAKNSECVALREINAGYTHSEKLTVFIEELIKEANVTFADIDAVAVSKGPGSYTGLRIGVSTAKGLCYALEKPLIALSTLKCLTQNFFSSFSRKEKNDPLSSSTPSLFCPMLDARRMEVYCALYDTKLNEIESVQGKIIDERSFGNYFKNNTIYFFGDGAPKCREQLGANKNAVFIDNIYPSAKYMTPFSESAFAAKQFEDVAYFEPYYLKDFVAGSK